MTDLEFKIDFEQFLKFMHYDLKSTKKHYYPYEAPKLPYNKGNLTNNAWKIKIDTYTNSFEFFVDENIANYVKYLNTVGYSTEGWDENIRNYILENIIIRYKAERGY